MRLTRLITFRSLSRRRLRSVLTLFGIVLGVAGIFSINFTNQNAYKSITRLFENTSGRVSLEIHSAANVGGIPEDVLNIALATEGVSQAVPVIKLPAALPGETPKEMDLNFFGTGTGGFLIYGIDPVNDLNVRDYRVSQGRFLDPEDKSRQVVLVEDYAIDNHIEVGQSIQVLTVYGLTNLEVVGFLAKEGAGLTNLGKFGVLKLADAQQLAQREGEVDQIDVVAEARTDDPAFLVSLRDTLAKKLGDDYAVIYPASQGDRMTQMLSNYQIGLNFMAGIALFVGAFLIYNAFSMTVVERTRELGLLRSIGMTRRQVTGQVIMEGLLLGIAGAAAGAGAGILISRGLTTLMSKILGQTLDSGSIPPGILAASMAIGLAVTVAAAFVPAYQAGRISPLEALRLRGRNNDGWLLKYGWIAGSALLALSAGILVWNPFPYDVQFRLGSLTVFALFLGAMLVIPVTLKGWQFLCRWPLRLIFGGLGEIGSRNLERARNRTMLTCAALLVGVSMIVVTQGMIGSFTADLYAWMDAYIGGDIFVGAAVPLTIDLKDELESLPGIDTAAPVRYIDVTWLKGEEEEKISFMAIDPVSYTAVTRFVFSDQDLKADAAVSELSRGGAIFISSVISEKFGLKPGDEMTIRTRDSEKAFKVAAVVLDFFNQGLVVTGSSADLAALFDVRDVSIFMVKAADGFTIPDVIRQITERFQEKYQLIIESNGSIKERADNLLRQAFSMFDVLGILAVLVAALGVLNTLSMSVLERTREIGMLRSIGMTRYQVVRMILAEAGLLGLIGGFLGLGFGLVLTRIFLAAMGAMSGYALDFVLPVRAIWLSPAAALVISQLAALVPAVRAARTPILSAINYE
jgi:putative ABC transport system permease protein